MSKPVLWIRDILIQTLDLLQVRIMLFSSVAFKMFPPIFFFKFRDYLLIEGSFKSVF